MLDKPEIPAPFEMNGRLYFKRSELEAYKKAVFAWATGGQLAPPAESNPPVEEFVSAQQAARELGVGRRTIGRRIVERAKSPQPVDEMVR